MSANFRKILFSGSKVEVTSISASNVPEITNPNTLNLEVLTIDNSTGRVNFVSQSILQVPNGDTTFSIKTTSPFNTTVNFESSGSGLNITTDNPNYLAVNITSGTNATTVSFDPAADFITGSAQLNAISHSITTDATDGNLNGPIDWQTAFYTPFIGYPPFDAAPQQGTISHNTAKISQILNRVIQDSPYTSSTANFWLNPNATTNPTSDNPLGGTLNPNASIAGRGNFTWLSASFLGGFTQGNTPSLSASLSSFTGSLETNSSSIGNLQVSSSNIIATTSSMALNSFTSSFLRQVTAKNIVSSFHGNQPIPQVTILTDVNGNNFDSSVDPQGRIIQIGAAAPGGSPLEGFPTSRHLTISGTFTANNLVFGQQGILLEQVNIAAVAGGINYGTSSLHTHQFLGVVSTSGSINVTGSVSIGTALPTQDSPGITVDNPVQILVKSGSSNTLKVTTINNTNNIIDNEIRSTATAISQSFLQRISNIQTNIDAATGDGTNIANLQIGYGTLTASYDKGILLGTGSSAANAISTPSSISGLTQDLNTHTASFSASIEVGPNSDHTVVTSILTPSHSISGNNTTIHYIFNTSSFISATNIFTASQAIINTVNGLNRYGKRISGIITGSTAGNILHISNLATDLPGGSGKHFLTGAAQPFSSVTNKPNLFNGFSTLTQGHIDFTLDSSTIDDADFKDLNDNDSPQFTNLTIDNNVTVEGTLVRINKSNLNIEDQFILINSGALPGNSMAANASNDPDGGIIVGNGNNSGSMFMYDKTHERWGFIGADGNNLQALNVESNEDNTLTPNLGVRVTVFNTTKFNSNGLPLPISNFEYGNSDQNTQLGIMAICNDVTKNPDGDVYIYA